jgi:CelD/BcsL family acetyltransferase involved in cellulose biosynthesis
LNKKARNDHLRGKRILGQHGRLTFREIIDDPIDPLLMWASDLKRDWLAKHHETSPLLRSDYNALIGLVRALASLDALRVFILECDGQPVAVSINILQNQVMLAFFATYDPRFERGSPGIVLMTEYTMWAFDRGIQTVDYLRGEEAYKFRFANVAVQMSSLIAAKTPLGALGLMAYRLKTRNKAVERSALGTAYRTPSGLLRQPNNHQPHGVNLAPARR